MKKKAQSVPTPLPVYVYTDTVVLDVSAPNVTLTNAAIGVTLIIKVLFGYAFVNVIS